MLSPDEMNMDLLSRVDKNKRKEIIGNFKWSLRSEGIDLIEEHSVDRASERLIEWSGIDKQKKLEEI